MKLKLLIYSLLFFTNAAGAAIAPLWIPAQGADIEPVLSALEADENLRLTAALDSLEARYRERINALTEAGRLELAVRPIGDPPLPLLYYPGLPETEWAGKNPDRQPAAAQYFLAARLQRACDSHKVLFSSSPAGLVSPPGGLLTDYAPLSKALGLSWSAAGPAAGGTGVDVSQGFYYIHFSTPGATPYPAPGGTFFTVFDCTASGSPEAAEDLLRILHQGSGVSWMTVSEALELEKVFASTSPAGVPWSGDYTPWASSGTQAGALAAMAKTRSDLMFYLNEKQGDYKSAEAAFESYFSAENSESLLALGSDSDAAHEAEQYIINSLAAAYRLMGRNPPQWALSGLNDAGGGTGETAGGGPVITAENSGIRIAAGTAAGKDGWKLAGLTVNTDRGGTEFTVSPVLPDENLQEARVHIYIDINHRPRAGLTQLLSGAAGRMFPDSAWDYAIEFVTDMVV